MPTEPSPAILAIFADHPGIIKWFGVLFVIGYGLKLASQMSETFSKYLGRLGRRWHRQGAATTREARRRANTTAQVDHLATEVAYLTDRLKEHDRRAAAARYKMDMKDEFIVYDIDWHADNDRYAAAHGWVWPLPRHMNFDEFAVRYRDEHPAPEADPAA